MKSKLWKFFFLFLCATGIFFSCSSKEKREKVIPPAQQQRPEPTPFPTRPPKTPTPTGSQAGGLSGVYSLVHDQTQTPFGVTKCFELLRFYPDGAVLTASNCNADSLEKAWEKIGRWFHHGVGGSPHIPRGTYQTLGKRVWFVTHSKSGNGDKSKPVEVVYSGQISGGQLVLDTYSHFTGFERKGAKIERFEPPTPESAETPPEETQAATSSKPE